MYIILQHKYIVHELLGKSALKSFFNLSQYSHNIHQTEYEHMLFQPSNCCITTPTFVWVKTDHLYSTHHRLSQDTQSCTAQLSHVFTAVNKRLAGVIFILFTKPKWRKNNPLPTATTSSVPRGLQPRQQNKEEYFKKCRVENNSEIWKHVGL